VDFSKLFTKSKPVLNSKVIAGVAIVIIVFILISILSQKPATQARDFLPTNTSFFYEWADRKSFDNQLPAQPNLFDYDVPAQQISHLQQILGNIFTSTEEAIWFRVNHTENDNYILRFSGLSSDILENFKASHPEYLYYQPNNDILVITQAPEIIKDIKDKKISSFTVNHIKRGVNLYWYLGQAPEFLEKISSLIKSSFDQQKIFMNIELRDDKKGSINIFQINNQPENISNSLDLLKIPKDFNQAIGFNASSTNNLDNFLITNLLLPIYDSLPYYSLGKQKTGDYFLNNDIIFQQDEDWLIISENDKRVHLLDLLDNFAVLEVSKVLADGTAYTELVAKPDLIIVDHQIMGQSYWQIDGLFGMNFANHYYLSNRQYLIEDSIKSNRNIDELWATCLASDNYRIKDFISWETDKLPESLIRSYLQDNNLSSLRVFSYYNSIITGLKWCF